ncbi:hypothetical protein BIT28_07540 [Photobacterium proteolyticum]|uniref:Integrase n=1 Tax=Photobacterium proteolyticum TaxID=1903952 RepID=A0A1Q9G6D3_9GAMM|nr:hypothetical protein [Photobacterium proteolyticum]OLQ69827.1 hypothetical protein BIT28_07540 [Photobacterium proteolyticum]
MAITNKNTFEQLKQSFEGQRRYRAKNDAYIFDIFDDEWQLGTKEYLYLEWMYDQGYDWQTFVDLRVILAKNANQRSRNTASIRARAFKSLGNNLSPAAFQLAWLSLTDNDKQKLASALSFAVKKAGFTQFKEVYEFAQANQPNQKMGNTILDPEKGVYSEIEYDSIKEELRLATDNQKKTCYGSRDVLAFGNLIACQLMVALIRRPVQLAELKWADALPVGQSFSNHRQNKNESVPTSEYLFSDVERLQLRTFRGKDGAFRGSAEPKSHRLETDLSVLLLTYRKQYELVLIQSLENQGISLTNDERRLIMLRCPLFPEEQLFTMKFKTKSNLFKALGFMSDAFHKRSKALQKAITGFTANLDLKSDRIESDKLRLGNNRLRHTVLTLGARQGLPAPYLAKITGGTEQSVKAYVDLSFEARLEIDQAFAKKEVLTKFGSIAVNDLLKQDEYVVRNEFDEEMGIRSNPANCASCASKLGAPLGCYPCDNFHANEDADHKHYLDKALVKYNVNKEKGNQVTLSKLRKIILYIQVTIDICEERKLAKKGLCHA